MIRAGIERAGWSETARRSGIDRTTLHRNFPKCGSGNPKLETIVAVLPHVGLELTLSESAQCPSPPSP